MTNKYVLGLDIGTTSTKAVIFNYDGTVLVDNEEFYDTFYPHPGWVEQNPEEINVAAKKAIFYALEKSNISPNQLKGVGISSAMHSLICVDHQCLPLSPSITWADRRSATQANTLKETHPHIYLKTGTPLHPMSPLCKLRWMHETGYMPYRNASKFISIKEYLLYKWFGSYVVDYSIASATGLFNIYTHQWEAEALSLAGITTEQLSLPVPPSHILQGINKSVAADMGIQTDLPFVIGASDGPLANLGIGAIDHGDIAITIGTSGAIRQMTNKPQLDENHEVFCYSFTKDLWIMGGPSNNGGNVFQWMKGILGEKEMAETQDNNGEVYSKLTELAASSSPGAKGLLFLPYLHGERAPYWDSSAKGCLIGLDASHQKKDLLRAGLEGVIFNMYTISQAMSRLSGEPKKILVTGGFVRSKLWTQMVSDIFGHKIDIPLSHQSAAWGAAWIALFSLQETDSLLSIRDHIHLSTSLTPNPENHQLYQELFTIYSKIYFSLAKEFKQLANFQQSHS